MTNALSLGQFVFFGSRKGVVIERTHARVTVCWFDKDGQHIEEGWLTRVLSAGRNVRRSLGQSKRAAITAHLFGGLPIDRSVVFAGLFALIATGAVVAAFIASIACRWAV